MQPRPWRQLLLLEQQLLFAQTIIAGAVDIIDRIRVIANTTGSMIQPVEGVEQEARVPGRVAINSRGTDA